MKERLRPIGDATVYTQLLDRELQSAESPIEWYALDHSFPGIDGAIEDIFLKGNSPKVEEADLLWQLVDYTRAPVVVDKLSNQHQRHDWRAQVHNIAARESSSLSVMRERVQGENIHIQDDYNGDTDWSRLEQMIRLNRLRQASLTAAVQEIRSAHSYLALNISQRALKLSDRVIQLVNGYQLSDGRIIDYNGMSRREKLVVVSAATEVCLDVAFMNIPSHEDRMGIIFDRDDIALAGNALYEHPYHLRYPLSNDEEPSPHLEEIAYILR